MSLQRKTPMKRTAMKRKPMKRKTSKRTKRPSGSPNDFPEPVRLAVRMRSGGECEVRSHVCTGAATGGPHHRKLRGSKDQREVNALAVCRPCHRHIHDNTGKSYLMGWLVHFWDDPATVPVKRGDGGR